MKKPVKLSKNDEKRTKMHFFQKKSSKYLAVV